jgi:hypothetical protein
LQHSLEALGWSQHFADAFAPYEPAGLIPGRVAVQERGAVVLFTTAGTVNASGQAVAGDWVAAEALPGEERAIVRAVLPRRTRFARKEPWLTEEQVVAANIDTVFLVTDCGRDFKPRTRALSHGSLGQRRRSGRRPHEGRPRRESRGNPGRSGGGRLWSSRARGQLPDRSRAR